MNFFVFVLSELLVSVCLIRCGNWLVVVFGMVMVVFSVLMLWVNMVCFSCWGKSSIGLLVSISVVMVFSLVCSMVRL